MAKKLKKRKKLTRRARRTPAAAAAAKQDKGTGIPRAPRPQEPVGISREVEQAPPAPAAAATTVTFRDQSRERSPEGVDAELAAAEYPAVQADLRKLGVTIVVFAAVITALALLQAQTGAVTDLGERLFRLWQ